MFRSRRINLLLVRKRIGKVTMKIRKKAR